MFESIKNIKDLKAAIQSLVVKDYGDFKRKVVLYLNRYNESKSLSEREQIIFQKMIDRIQFHPTMDIESTRSWSLDQLDHIQ